MARRLEYHHLTERQVALISNGCGGRGGPFNPPDLCFGGACDRHDFHYWRGGSKFDRMTTDRQFLRDMLHARKTRLDTFLAVVYYQAVRVFGAKHWNWGPERSFWDLVKLEIDDLTERGEPIPMATLLDQWKEFEGAA